jgi:hypothetical protein
MRDGQASCVYTQFQETYNEMSHIKSVYILMQQYHF